MTKLGQQFESHDECDDLDSSLVSPTSREERAGTRPKGTKSAKREAEATSFRNAKLHAATDLAAATNKKANAMMGRIDIDIFKVNIHSSELSENQRRFFR